MRRMMRPKFVAIASVAGVAGTMFALLGGVNWGVADRLLPMGGGPFADGTAVTSEKGVSLSVTRTTTKYCKKSNGHMGLVGVNTLCVEPDGLRIDIGTQNRIPAGADVNMAAGSYTANGVIVTANVVTGPYPDAGLYAELLETEDGGYLSNSGNDVPGNNAAISYWFRSTDGGTASVKLREASGACETVQDVGASWTQVCCLGADQNPNVIEVYPAGDDAVGSVYATWGMLEGAAYCTQYHAEGTTSDADDVTFTTQVNQQRGCVAFEYRPMFTATNTPHSMGYLAFDPTDNIRVYSNNNATTTGAFDGTNVSSFISPWTRGERKRLRATWETFPDGGGRLGVGDMAAGTFDTPRAYAAPNMDGGLSIGSYGTSGHAPGWYSGFVFGSTERACD